MQEQIAYMFNYFSIESFSNFKIISDQSKSIVKQI